MKITQNQKTARIFARTASVITLTMMVATVGLKQLTAPVSAQNDSDDKQQWWNPADWFDDTPNNWSTDFGQNRSWSSASNSVSNEAQPETGYYNNYWNYDPFWGYGYDWGYEPSDYGWHYQWNPAADTWDYEYGYYDQYYDHNPTNNWKNSSGSKSPNRFQSVSNQNRHSPSVIQGTVESYRRANLKGRQGEREQHELIRITLESGQSTVVDLGRTGLLHRLDMGAGDQIAIRGQQGLIGGHQVFFATDIHVNGRNYPVTRQFIRSSPTSNPSATISGQLASLSDANIGGQDQTFLRVRLESGEMALVDLGGNFNSQQEQDLMQRANRGDWISVQGKRQNVDGHNVIKANQFWVRGQRIGLQQQQPRQLEQQ